MGLYLRLADQALARHDGSATTHRMAVPRPPIAFPSEFTRDKSDKSDQSRVLVSATTLGVAQAGVADLDERAAIAEYDGMVPRAWAEGFARLQMMPPPGDVPLARWCRFVDDAGRFLDGGWAARAAALGWAAENLFGLDTTGLIFMLNGGTLVALARDKAVIRMPTGSTTTYCRDPDRRGVAAWALAPADNRGPTTAAMSGVSND